MQRAALEIVLLALGAGVLGTWVVLRGLSFYAHAVGTAAFPGLVLADGLGFGAGLGAAATAGLTALLVALLARRREESYDSATALVLVGALAAGVILASNVFHSQASVERLLFGSLLSVGATDQVLAAAVALAALVLGVLLGRRWVAAGFDPAATRALGARSPLPDLLLIGLVALGAIASLAAIGALLATAILVVPAATTRLAFDRLASWQVATAVLAAAEGIGGIWLSIELNAPPGATIAVLSAAVFALTALGRSSRRRAVGAAALTVAALVATGCSVHPKAAQLRGVVATTTQLGDLVRNVAGPTTHLTQLLRPNADPHDYEPRPQDVVAVARAEVVFVSGDGLDAWMAEVIENSGGHPRVVDAGAGRPERIGGDPHWWHDPRNVAHAVERIGAALGARAQAAAVAYRQRVLELDAHLARCFASIPAGERKLVTDHDAFAYFARRYGIEVVGAAIPSQSTQAQASAGDLSRLSELIRRAHVKAVFPEASVSAKVARALAAQTGATARYELYGDTLGPAGSRGATYLGMERANADAIMRGLTGGARGC